jgi:hypothetical protein
MEWSTVPSISVSRATHRSNPMSTFRFGSAGRRAIAPRQDD